MIIAVAATQNKHKLAEMNEILEQYGIRLISVQEAGIGDIEIVEDGDTFEKNSMKKAATIMNISGKPAIADDSGLSVDALQGGPGVYSARYAGENATDKENNKKLLKELEGINNRQAKFVSVISLAFPDGKKISARGECHGRITYEERGSNGFGYDPLFIPEGYDKTFGELDADIKNKISHRAKALQKLQEELEQLITNN